MGAPRSLCQGDCLPRSTRTLSGKTDGRGRNEREEGIQEMAKSKLRKKSPSSSAARSAGRPLSFSLLGRGRRRAVVGEFFPQRTNSPTFCCSGVFPSPSRTREGGEKVDISRDAALSLYPSIGSCYAAVTAASADRRGRTDGEADVGTDGRGRTLRRRPRASPLKEREKG